MDLGKSIDSMKDEMIQTTQEILAIRSVKEAPLHGKPFGEGIHQALEYALTLCDRMGLVTENFDGYAGHAEFGHGEETLGILVHLDVVPEGSGWSYPPYGAEIHHGCIYARGAIDDKGPAIAALYGLKAVMNSGKHFHKKVRIIFGCDEESGWEDIEYYKTKQKMPDFGLTPDGAYPVINTEKGILQLILSQTLTAASQNNGLIREIHGGTRVNVVPDEAICILDASMNLSELQRKIEEGRERYSWELHLERIENGDIRVVSHGKSAHGSTPEAGRNAASKLLIFLHGLSLGDDPASQFIAFLVHHIGLETDGQSLGLQLSDEISGKLTCNLGIINLSDDHAEGHIDIRYPVHYLEEEILERIQKETELAGVQVQIASSKGPLHVPKEHFLIQKLMEVYTRLTGKEAYTIAIGGGTYARALENAVAFGPVFPGQEELAHQKDEYIGIDDLVLNAKIYAQTIYELIT